MKRGRYATAVDMTVREVSNQMSPKRNEVDIRAMPTVMYPGVEAVFCDSGVSESQFWTAKMTATHPIILKAAMCQYEHTTHYLDNSVGLFLLVSGEDLASCQSSHVTK